MLVHTLFLPSKRFLVLFALALAGCGGAASTDDQAPERLTGLLTINGDQLRFAACGMATAQPLNDGTPDAALTALARYLAPSGQSAEFHAVLAISGAVTAAETEDFDRPTTESVPVPVARPAALAGDTDQDTPSPDTAASELASLPSLTAAAVYRLAPGAAQCRPWPRGDMWHVTGHGGAWRAVVRADAIAYTAADPARSRQPTVTAPDTSAGDWRWMADAGSEMPLNLTIRTKPCLDKTSGYYAYEAGLDDGQEALTGCAEAQ